MKSCYIPKKVLVHFVLTGVILMATTSAWCDRKHAVGAGVGKRTSGKNYALKSMLGNGERSKLQLLFVWLMPAMIIKFTNWICQAFAYCTASHRKIRNFWFFN